MWGISWRDFLTAIIAFLSDHAIALFLICLIIFGFLLARAPGWKGKFMVGLLTLYGLIIVMVFVLSAFLKPENRLAFAEVNATFILLALAVACLVAAATLVRCHAYAFALACLAVPPVLSIPVVAIIHLLIPGPARYAPIFSM